MLKILINPGHCGCEPGAVSGGISEREINLKVALYMREYLAEYENVTAYLTRETNKPCNGVHIADVIKTAQEKGCGLIFSVHHNAGGGRGSEVYYQPTVPESKALAEAVLNECIAVGRKSRGLKSGSAYRLLNGSTIPTIMTEYAFVDNAADREAIDSYYDLRLEARAFVNAIVKIYKLKKKPAEQPKPAEKPQQGEMYRVGKSWKNGACVGQIGAFAVKAYAVNFAKNHPGTKVFDSKGTVIYTPTPKKGDKITLKNAPLYASSSTKKPTRVLSGTYYIYDGVLIGGRYRITVAQSLCGKLPVWKNVTGYVEAGEVISP